MDEKSFKKLLDEVLVPIKKDLTEVKQTQEMMKQSQNEMKQAQKKVQDTLDNRVIPSITETEMTVKSYADSYKINKHNIERLDSRLSTAEEKLDIKPAENLKVPHFTNQS